MRVKERTTETKTTIPHERIILTLEIPKNSIFSASVRGKGSDPKRVNVKVEDPANASLPGRRGR